MDLLFRRSRVFVRNRRLLFYYQLHRHHPKGKKKGGEKGVLFRDVPHLTPSLVAAPLSVLQMFKT